MLRIYASKYIKEINQLLGVLPSDMLLLLKTNDCLRHLDAQLGTPINTTLVITETIADVILREDLYGWWKRRVEHDSEYVEDKAAVDGLWNRVNEVPAATGELYEIVTTYSGLLSRVIGMSVLAT
jgi:hypothetical protein